MTVDDWRNVIFSDEVSLHIIMSRSRRYVRSRARQPVAYRPTVQVGGSSVMMWGAFHGVNTCSLIMNIDYNLVNWCF